MKRVLLLVQRHRQAMVNIFLVLVLGQYIVRETKVDLVFSRPALIDVTFFVHNVLFMIVIIVRKEYVLLDKDWLHWCVSLLSFFSGLFFLKSSGIQGGLLGTADVINFIAILVGIASFLSLGRSFGIVPALRVVRTGGLYAVVRHPMFVSDILFKVPIVLKYFSIYNSLVFVVSLGLYVLRARYEEELLSQSEEYRLYKERVRYRFIPLVY